MSRPQNSLNLTPTLNLAYFMLQKVKKKITLKLDKIKSNNGMELYKTYDVLLQE